MLKNSAFFRVVSSLVIILLFFSVASATYLIERLFKKILVPCFDVYYHPQCQTSLPETFESNHRIYGPNEPDTLMYLFTPKHTDIAEPLHSCGGKLPPDTNYDVECETEIIIHGWLDGICRTAWMRELKEQIFQRKEGCYNVILVDWSWGNTPKYMGAEINTKVVGDQVRFIVNNIMIQTGVGPEMFHLIGHSLGSTIGGFVCRYVKGIRRLTALDPPVLAKDIVPLSERFTSKDAEIVDVIHTNALDCLSLGVGDSKAMGHVDFYPNGGTYQPSCHINMLLAFLKQDFFYGLFNLIPQYCSHFSAVQYFKSSINCNGCQFVGIASEVYSNSQNGTENYPLRRDQWAVMGMDYENYKLDNVTPGKRYLLPARAFCPYVDNSHVEMHAEKFPFQTSCPPTL